MNEKSATIKLSDLMITAEGWGREQGRTVYGKMIDFIEKNPGITAFQISFEGVRRMDFSFASESLVELARRYCGHKGFYLSEPIDADIVENVGAAAEKKKQPLIVWDKEEYRIIGMSPRVEQLML